jgi:hypothetical protein
MARIGGRRRMKNDDDSGNKRSREGAMRGNIYMLVIEYDVFYTRKSSYKILAKL